MKKISRTVAMILIPVMLAGSFTGCHSFGDAIELTLKIGSAVLIGGMILIGLTIFADAGSPEQHVYLAGTGDSPPETELSLLKEKFALLPETDIAALVKEICAQYYSPKMNVASSTKTGSSMYEAGHVSGAPLLFFPKRQILYPWMPERFFL
jgi:hypothetical protein